MEEKILRYEEYHESVEYMHPEARSPPLQSSEGGSKLVSELLFRMKSKKMRFMLVDTEEMDTRAIGFFEMISFFEVGARVVTNLVRSLGL
jgi:hypothetical protein